MRKQYIFLFTFLLAFLTVTFSTNVQAAPLDEAKSIVQSYYVGEINGDINKATTMDQLVDMLDPYSDYYSYKEFIELTNSIDQKNVGIGIIVEQVDEGILIVNVIENGSAFESYLQAGEIITHVNGVSIKGYSTDRATSLIKGPEGTTVTLMIKKSDGTSYTKTLTRKAFSVPVVMSSLLYGNIGYISLSSFSENGAHEVKNAAVKLQQQGAKSFIIDLQNNSGGYVTTAQQLIGFFPNTSQAYIEKQKNKVLKVKTLSLNYKLPGTSRILINRYSASASEMVAASVIDQQAATVYGEKSYGKGTVQGFYSLSDGSILKLTQAEFIGPNNTPINQVGVNPQVETKSNPLFAAHLDAITDQYSNYKQLKSFTNVPTTKTFTLTFNKTITSSIPESAIELVTLGGNTIDITLEKSDSQLIITPKEPLRKGTEYVLLVHPNQFTSDYKQLKQGYYSHISVEN